MSPSLPRGDAYSPTQIHAPGPIPRDNRAALDGFAVQASASLGASPYNPIRLPLVGVAAGDALPAGTDAVIPVLLAETDDQAYIEIVEAVATGDNVEPQGATAAINAMRTTPLVSPLRKTEPIGGLQSRPSPGNTGSAHPGTGRALLFLSCPRHDSVVLRCSAFARCSKTPSLETR
jgi:hypothetical protein